MHTRQTHGACAGRLQASKKLLACSLASAVFLTGLPRPASGQQVPQQTTQTKPAVAGRLPALGLAGSNSRFSHLPASLATAPPIFGEQPGKDKSPTASAKSRRSKGQRLALTLTGLGLMGAGAVLAAKSAPSEYTVSSSTTCSYTYGPAGRTETCVPGPTSTTNNRSMARLGGGVGLIGAGVTLTIFGARNPK
jgi:hypothetical protein